jgi:hypothetical protein
MTVKPFSRLNYNARNYNVVSAVMVPVYGVTASSSSINEGTAVTYTITTQYVLDGTVLYWTTSGTTVAADFSDGVISGSVTMTNGTATVVRTLLADILTEGAETIVFELRTVSISGTIVASTPSGTVNDTSVLTITPSTSSVNEGSSVTWTISAVGFGTGTLYYTNSGTTNAADFSDGLNSGSITITADSGTLTKTLQLDLSTEGSETIIIQIRTGSTAGTVVGTSNTVTVADTSFSSQSYSVYFNTAASGLSVAHNTALDLSSGDFTIECWYYKNTTSVNGEYIVAKSGNAGNRFHAYCFASSGTNTYSFNLGNSTGASIIQGFSFGTLNLNTWYHLAATKSGSTITLFVNGTQVASAAQTITIVDNGSALTVGNQYTDTSKTVLTTGGSQGQLIGGYVSNLRIIKGTAIYTAGTNFTPPTDQLSAVSGTVLLTCKNASFSDSSSNAFTVNSVGTNIIKMENPFGDYSMSFNGSNQYLSIASNSNLALGTGDFTIEYWVYLNSYGPSNYGLYDQRNGTNGSGVIQPNFSVDATNGYVWYVTAGLRITSGTAAVVAQRWQHLAVVRNSGITKMFIDGVQAGSSYTDSNNYPAGSIFLGHQNDGASANYLNGYMSNVRTVKGTAVYPWIPATTALTTTSQNATASQVSLLTAQSATIVNNGASGNITYIPSSTYAALFNSSYLYVTGSLNFAFDAGNFTMEAWVYQTASANPGIATTWNGGGAWGFALSSNYLTFTWTNVPSGISSPSVTGTTQQITLNAWNHVAVVRNGATITLYVNGVADATTLDVSTNINYYYNGNLKDLRIGIGSDGGGYFPGYISNFRIVKGTAVYTSNFTPSGPLTNITNTILLTLQSATFVDNSSSPYTVNASSMTTTAIGAYPLSITNGGTVTAGNSVIPFASTYSYQFNGTNQYLYIPPTPNLVFGTGDFTVEFWYYMTSYGSANQQLIDFRGTGTDILNMAIYLENAAGTGTKQLRFLAANADRAVTASSFTLNAWVHVALVRTGGYTRFFTNAQQVGSTYTDGNSYTFPTGLCIGSYRNTSAFFNGYISNLRIVNGNALYAANFVPSNSPLTAITNTSLLTCQYAELVDASTNKFAITNTGSTPAATQNPFGYYATDFTGTAQYLTLPRTAGALTTGPFTIECWVRPRAYADGTIILNNGFWNGGSNGAWQLMFNANGTVLIQLSNGTWNTYPTLLTSTIAVTLNVWTHIAVVRNSSNVVQLYINGVGLASPPTSSASWSTAYGTSAYWFTSIGAANGDGTWGGLLNGQVTNVRIVNGTAVYTGNFTPQTTPLTLTQSAGTTNIAAITSGTQLLTCQYNIPVDTSPYSWAVTNNGSVTTYLTDIFSGIVSGVNYAQKNYSLSFDGSSQYVTSSATTISNFGSSNFTFECWIYCTNVSVNSVIYDGRATSGNGLNLYVTLREVTNGKLSVCTNGSILYTSTATLANNTWYHIAVVRSGTGTNQTAVYINGASDGTFTNSTVYVNPFNTIGAASYTAGAAKFPGYISNLRIVNGTAVYTSAFTPSTTPLKAIANTSLLTAQYNTLFDASVNKFALTRVGNTDMVNVYPFPV